MQEALNSIQKLDSHNMKEELDAAVRRLENRRETKSCELKRHARHAKRI